MSNAQWRVDREIATLPALLCVDRPSLRDCDPRREVPVLLCVDRPPSADEPIRSGLLRQVPTESGVDDMDEDHAMKQLASRAEYRAMIAYQRKLILSAALMIDRIAIAGSDEAGFLSEKLYDSSRLATQLLEKDNQ